MSDNIARRPKITISRETTHILGPLRPDGYVDYAGALNRLRSEGVTPQNNAMVSFWKAIGPKAIEKEARLRYFKLLGMAEPPENGPYWIDLLEFLGEKDAQGGGGPSSDSGPTIDEIGKQFDQARRRPWSAEEFPLIAALLERNARPLSSVGEGVQRPRWFSPLLAAGSRPLISWTPWPDMGGMAEVRSVFQQLTAGAMLRVHRGEVEHAWKDLIACHRLARHIWWGPLRVDALVALTLESVASMGTVSLAHRGNLTAEQVRRFQAALWELPPKQPWWQIENAGERFYALGWIIDLAIRGHHPPSLDPALAADIGEGSDLIGPNSPHDMAIQRLVDDPRIDWDEALRYCNACADSSVAELKKPIINGTSKLRADRSRELNALYEQAKDHPESVDSLPAAEVPRTLARQLVSLVQDFTFGPRYLQIEQKSDTYLNLAHLALALAGYHHDHGCFPKKLRKLAPEYIPEVPRDLFGGGELIYKPEGDGYLLYSVGLNGKDDGGRNYWEEHERFDESATEEELSADDIAIRTPTRQHG
jgi:hypothetical protein